jgi:hypothetical protein
MPMDGLVNRKRVEYDSFRSGTIPMGYAASETEIGERAARYLKAELKRADVTYQELAVRLKEHGLPCETEHSIKAKLKRGTFPATFFLATLAALEKHGVGLADI